MQKVSRFVLPAILIGPFLLALLVVLVWPMGQLVSMSFGIDAPTLANYKTMFANPRFWEALRNTLSISFASTLLALAFCVPAAIYLESPTKSKLEQALRRAAVVILSIPLSLPGIVIGFFVILFVGNTGIVPKIFEIVVGERRLQIAYSYYGILLGYIYFQIPRIILVIRGEAAKLSWDAVLVARTLGATTFRTYFTVILPQIRSAMLSAGSLSVATAFGAFGTAATLSRGFRVVPLEIASAFTENFQPEMAAAMSVVLTFTIISVLLGIWRIAGGVRVEE